MEEADGTLVRLLDLDPELGARLRDDDRAEARDRLVLRTTVLPKGEWSLQAEGGRSHPFGLIVVEGLLLSEVRLGARACQQLLGPGDVVLPDRPASASLEAPMRLVAAAETRVAVLDDRLQAPFRLWPGLALGLLERVGRQLNRAAVQAAIAQLPRVEDRLEATFWDLADRWGRVTPTGIHLPLRLTHEALARLVGGRRPTISLALGDLAEREIVARHGDGTWFVVARAPSADLRDAGRTGGGALAEAAPVAVLPEAAPLPRRAPPTAPWAPGARAAMLDSVRRAQVLHDAASERAGADESRYSETRRRSQALREAAARDRDARAVERASRRDAAPLSGPPAPSAG